MISDLYGIDLRVYERNMDESYCENVHSAHQVPNHANGTATQNQPGSVSSHYWHMR